MACAFQKRTDTDADELLRRAGSFEVLRSDARHETVHADTVALEPARAFLRLRLAYEALGLTLSHTDSAERVLAGQVAPMVAIDGEQPAYWLDCGVSGPATYDVWYASRVTPAADGRSVLWTVLRVDTHRSRRRESTASPCVSRGTLEAALAERVRRSTASR